MNQRNFSYTLLGIALSTMIAPAAMAKTCLLRSTSGACLFYVGSVECTDLGAKGFGTGDDKSFKCSVTPPGGADVFPGIVFCQNSGAAGTVPYGANFYLSSGELSGTTALSQYLDGNGKAIGGKVSIDLIQDPETQAALDGVCHTQQNDNWTAKALVLQAMDATVQVVDSAGDVLQNNSTSFHCYLANPDALYYDNKIGKVTADSESDLQYTCERVN